MALMALMALSAKKVPDPCTRVFNYLVFYYYNIYLIL